MSDKEGMCSRWSVNIVIVRRRKR